ncbi:hypothetical protein MATL_G00056170 [Megalops atlanticus]|uniref:Uncharacterized protein n=1 Tax=Megalops atlanticus TaxID=7932 RepID=A0A9D3TCW6_MEGAT|nr:hypothetical protein MATL_G00056170 [Megalops atlanticus]
MVATSTAGIKVMRPPESSTCFGYPHSAELPVGFSRETRPSPESQRVPSTWKHLHRAGLSQGALRQQLLHASLPLSASTGPGERDTHVCPSPGDTCSR